ncbi:MAG: glycine cleavage system protein H [Kiritimatiellaeota bacterium]|nr:glycine cleavage system protein H [Kiritimatiellota bacterium]
MEEYLEATYDKFIFRVKTDCRYTKDEFWAAIKGRVATVGMTDFQQKSKGDVTILTTVAPGTELKQGQTMGDMETIKATIDLIAPVTGKVVEVNPALRDRPFLINDEPHGAGWIYRIELADPEGDAGALLSAAAYFELLKEKIVQEAKNLYG